MRERLSGQERRVALLAVPAAVVVAALLAMVCVQMLQASLETYQPGYPAFPSEPVAGQVPLVSPEKALAQRVVVVVVDGLRDDTSGSLPFLNALRERGAWGSVRTGEPSYSRPSYAVLSSGSWPEVAGVILNSFKGRMSADSLFRRAREAGLVIAIAADGWWGEVNGPVFDLSHFYTGEGATDVPALDQAACGFVEEVLARGEARLVLLHLSNVDHEGHVAGARRAEYMQAAMVADSQVRRVAAALDFSRDALIVTADHGMLWRNIGGGSGHGGWEPEVTTVPLVASGAGINPGSLAQEVRQVDLAPTIAALLGTPVPAQAQGRVVWEALRAAPAYRAAFEVERGRTLASFARAYLESVGVSGERAIRLIAPVEGGLQQAAASLAAGQGEKAARDAAAANDELLGLMARARQARLSRERLLRGMVALVVAGGVVAGLVILGRTGWAGEAPPPVGKMLAGAAAGYLVLHWATYRFVFGYCHSLSVFPDGRLTTFLRLFGVPACVAVALVWVGVWWRRRGGLEALQVALLGAALSQVFLYGLGYVWNGARISWCLPDFRVGFLQMSSLLQILCLGMVALASLTWAIIGREPRNGCRAPS